MKYSHKQLRSDYVQYTFFERSTSVLEYWQKQPEVHLSVLAKTTYEHSLTEVHLSVLPTLAQTIFEKERSQKHQQKFMENRLDALREGLP